MEFRFDLDAFRSTKPAGGFLDKFINDEIRSIYLLGRDTIYPEELKETRLMCIRCIYGMTSSDLSDAITTLCDSCSVIGSKNLHPGMIMTTFRNPEIRNPG